MEQHFPRAANTALHKALTMANRDSLERSRRTFSNTSEGNSNVMELARRQSDFLRSIDPATFTSRDLAKLHEIAHQEEPRLAPCSEREFKKYMLLMDATLKSRDIDLIGGKLRMRAYFDRLGRFPSDAVYTMTEHFIDNAIFFPAISECLDFLSSWRHPIQLTKKAAQALLMRQADTILTEARLNLRAGNFSPDRLKLLTDRMKRILETEGLLRREGDTYTIRERPILSEHE